MPARPRSSRRWQQVVPGASASTQVGTTPSTVTAPPTKTCVRPRKVDERGRRVPATICSPGHKRARVASAIRSRRSARGSMAMARLAGCTRIHSMATCSRNPRRRPRAAGPARARARQRNGANLVLGDLPVLIEGAVRQARAGQQHRVRVGHTLDRHDRQAAVRRFSGRRDRLGVSAEIGEDSNRARPEAAPR